MIPENYLREWKEHAPWKTDRMVEQDLIICFPTPGGSRRYGAAGHAKTRLYCRAT
jgi:hypothetical protein